MTHGAPQRAATLWLATLPGHRAEARWKSNRGPDRRPSLNRRTLCAPGRDFVPNCHLCPNPPTVPPGFVWQDRITSSPNAHSLRRTRQPKGRKKPQVRMMRRSYPPGARLTIHQCRICPNARKGRNGAQACRLIRTRRHACSFALANRGHDTRAWRPRRKPPRGNASPAGAVRMPKALRAKSSHQGGTLPRAAPF